MANWFPEPMTDRPILLCKCGWNPFEDSERMCQCGHKGMKHSSYDADHKPVALGSGLCSFCSCQGFVGNDGYVIRTHASYH